MTFAQPVEIKRVNLLESRGFVPFAFVHRNHAPALASDAAARQKVGRIGENQIEGFGFGAVQKFERIALIQTQATFRIEPKRFGSLRRNGGANFGREVGIRLEKRDGEAQIGMLLSLRQYDQIVSGSSVADQVFNFTQRRREAEKTKQLKQNCSC